MTKAETHQAIATRATQLGHHLRAAQHLIEDLARIPYPHSIHPGADRAYFAMTLQRHTPDDKSTPAEEYLSTHIEQTLHLIDIIEEHQNA